jgi:hypothetical protein
MTFQVAAGSGNAWIETCWGPKYFQISLYFIKDDGQEDEVEEVKKGKGWGEEVLKNNEMELKLDTENNSNKNYSTPRPGQWLTQYSSNLAQSDLCTLMMSLLSIPVDKISRCQMSNVSSWRGLETLQRNCVKRNPFAPRFELSLTSICTQPSFEIVLNKIKRVLQQPPS